MTSLPAGQNRVFLIAEIASSHDGDRTKMSKAIQVAKEAGADAVKFQWVSSPERLAARRHAEEYLWAYRTIAFPQEWLASLKVECDTAGIEFMCTVFLPEDIPHVAPWVKRFKIASAEAGDQTFREAHEGWGKPIIVSTGGMDEAELRKMRGVWTVVVNLSELYHLLHCVMAYPTPAEELNLKAMDGLDGLSDHTGNVLTGMLATARGASIIEVHFRLNSTARDNPDWLHSLSPNLLAAYIANVRLAEAALGTGEKRVMPSEERWLRYKVKA